MTEPQTRNTAHAALADWNAMAASAAAAAILPCNGSHAWAEALADLRPFASPEALFDAADHVWKALPASDWQQAFNSHPRIGEQKAHAATAESLRWSSGEQSAANPDSATKAKLRAANRKYEAKFDRIFLVCATGKTAAEMLAILSRRLGNDPASELLEAAEQQRQITQLRLRKWIGVP
jgi:2-oxo-4-hydroxy-4-carboxy-5-ureidoimidazoline decarboxylase